jgi:hypothetical protein
VASWDHAETIKPKARFHGISNHIWSIEELCDLLPENHKIGVQTDKALILKALDNAHSL